MNEITDTRTLWFKPLLKSNQTAQNTIIKSFADYVVLNNSMYSDIINNTNRFLNVIVCL